MQHVVNKILLKKMVSYPKNIHAVCKRSANKSTETQDKRGKLQYGENLIVMSCGIYFFSFTGVRAINRRNQRHISYGGRVRHIPNFGRGIHLGHPCADYVTLKKDLGKISCEDAKWDELSQNWARVWGDILYLSGMVCTSACF